ncbi:MAG: TIGR00730 family Rossman fold protein [Clostridia bacterium]|nr:TIGR00730 family Rossman fold protein [Clostridia bacterium]
MLKKNICVFCASSFGGDPVYTQVAGHLGTVLGQQGRNLVYGSSHYGLMGVVADAAQQQGSHVTGVNITKFDFADRVQNEDTYIVTKTLQERKVKMLELSDAFIALPGGIGTLDELMEILAMLQLHQTDKPIGLLNVKGFYDPFVQFVGRMQEEGFLKAEDQKYLIVREDAEELLRALDEAR